MFNIIKFLLVPILMIGINSNDCYSVEIDNVNGNNQNISTIKYTDQNITWEQWTKRANFEAINTNGEEYKNICDFCEKHKLSFIKRGIDCFIIEIYKLIYEIIYDSNIDTEADNCLDGELLSKSFAQENICLGYFYPRGNNVSLPEHELIKQWKTQRINTSISYAASIIEQNCNVITEQLMLKEIISTIREVQMKLNKDKYSNNNDMNNIASHEIINMMSGCYYISNKLVQLTHDILYAINDKINKYKNKKILDKQLCKEFRDYLIDEITLPCYKTISEALSLFIGDDSFIINNLNLYKINKGVLKKCSDFFRHLQNYWKNEFLIKTKCKLVYSFSNLGEELYKKNKEIINTLDKNINEMRVMLNNVKNSIIKKCLLMLVNKSYDDYVLFSNFDNSHGSHLIRYIRDNTSNNNIISMANMGTKCLYDEIFDFMRSVLIKGNFTNCEHNDPDVRQYIIAEKKLQNDLKKIDFHIPNIEYLNDMKYLFNKYKIEQNNNGTYDISANDIDYYDNDGNLKIDDYDDLI